MTDFEEHPADRQAAEALLQGVSSANRALDQHQAALSCLEVWSNVLTTTIVRTEGQPHARDLLAPAFEGWIVALTALYPEGVPSDDWRQLQAVVDTLSELADSNDVEANQRMAARRALERFTNAALVEEKPRPFLERSWLTNEGFWRYWAPAYLGVPPSLAVDLELRCALVRENGDIIVGTNRGLLVLRGSHWRWAVPNSRTREVELVGLDADLEQALANVHSLTEDRAGRLVVGLGEGLIRLSEAGAVTGSFRWWRGRLDGLPSKRVVSLITLDDAVLAVSPQGVARVSNEGERLAQPWASQAVVDALGEHPGIESATLHGNAILLAGRRGVIAIDRENPTRGVLLINERPESVVSVPGWERPIALVNERLIELGLPNADWQAPDPTVLRGSGEALRTFALHGLSWLPLDEHSQRAGLAILTDQGVSIHNGLVVQHLDPPDGFTARHVGIKAVNADNSRIVLISSDGLFTVDRKVSQRWETAGGPTRDVVFHPGWNRAVVSNDNGVHLVMPNGELSAIAYEANARLAIDKKNRLYMFDESRLYRWNANGSERVILKEMQPDIPDATYVKGHASLMIDRDGMVWFSFGASVYRFDPETEDLRHWSYYTDRTAFPSRTSMVANVVETFDGRIWAIGSNESHNPSPYGVRLVGGVVEFDGEGFVRVEEDRVDLDDDPWFITGYAAVSEERALVATNGGLAWHTEDGLQAINTDSDPTFNAVQDKLATYWLGCNPIEVGDGLWLVGTSSGVVGWQDGLGWFVPDRLNWMLPRQDMSQYGGRHVYGLAQSPSGDLYIASTHGGLHYEDVGADAVSLLASQRLAARGFESRDLQRREEELQRVLKADPNGEATLLVRRLHSLRETRSDPRRDNQSRPRDTRAEHNEPEEFERREARLNRFDRDRETNTQLQQLEDMLLKQLEDKYPSVFSLVTVSPFDHATVSRLLRKDEALVNYISTKASLFIQIIRHESQAVPMQLIRVDVPNTALQVLVYGDTNDGASTQARLSLSQLMLQPASVERDAVLHDRLKKLYQYLLAPIEPHLESVEDIIVVPDGSIADVPFSALVRSSKLNDIEYAVERFGFARAHNVSLLRHMGNNAEGQTQDAFIVADPGGDLLGAQQATERIAALLNNKWRNEGDIQSVVGRDATHDAVVASLDGQQIVHFAAHAVYDTESPENSYIQLSDGRLEAGACMALQLDGTILVLLAACESGVSGRTSQPFLARAFFYAGAQRAIATLGPVPDHGAATMLPVFYDHYTDGEISIAQSLRKAKQRMIAEKRDIAEWALFALFGRP